MRALVVLSREVSDARTLNLNHPRAHISKLPRTEWRCNGVLKTHDRDAI
jgi:hypothetical protein